MREFEVKAKFNDVEFVCFYEADGHVQLNSIYLADDPEANDLMPLLAQTVIDGLYAECESDRIDREYGGDFDCRNCSGTGEGDFDGAACRVCHGHGVESHA